MNNSQIIEQSWKCGKCGRLNYLWRSWCIYCFAENARFEKVGQGETTDINVTEIETRQSMSKDSFFDEAIEESKYALYYDDIHSIVRIYKNLIKKYESEDGDNSNKVIFINEQLALIYEPLWEIKKAVKLLEHAKAIWDRCYGSDDDDHYHFLLSMLSICYSSLYALPDCGPAYRPRKAIKCLIELYEINKMKYGRNSIHALTMGLNLVKAEFARKRGWAGVIYLRVVLDAHENIFKTALKRVSDNVQDNCE
jgi:hypothetical protein